MLILQPGIARFVQYNFDAQCAPTTPATPPLTAQPANMAPSSKNPQVPAIPPVLAPSTKIPGTTAATTAILPA